MTKEKNITPNKQREAKDIPVLFQVSQKLILFRADVKKYLILKDTDTESDFAQACGPWELVGGRISTSEKADESLAREVIEELGSSVEFSIIGPVARAVIALPTRKIFRVGILAEYHGGDVILSEENSEFVWKTAEEIANEEDYADWLKEFIQAAQERLREHGYLNDLKRLQADFENYKKRQEASQKEMGKFLVERLLTDLAPVLDNFHAAASHVPEASKGDPWVTGIGYIEKQLEDTLAQHGVRVIDVKEGDPFDPSRHEALSDSSIEGDERVEGEEKKGTLLPRFCRTDT